MLYGDLFPRIIEFGWLVIIPFLLVPAITMGLSWMHGIYDGHKSPWRQLYALVIHLYTLAIAYIVGAVSMYIFDGGTWQDGGIPWFPLGGFLASYLLVLIVVRRVVEFSVLLTVRNPLILLMGWLVGLAVGLTLYTINLWILPGAPVNTVLGISFLFFLITQMLFAVIRRPGR
jgi:hypothetical protein